MPTSLKLMLFFWQVVLVDTFSLIQFCINSGMQYGAIVVALAGGNFSDIGPKVLLEPILGLGVPEKNIRIEVGLAADTIQDRPPFLARCSKIFLPIGLQPVPRFLFIIIDKKLVFCLKN